MPLLEGFELPCSRVSIRAYREVRFGRIKGLDTGGSRGATRLIEGASSARVNGCLSGECACPTRAGGHVSIF